MSNVKDHPTKNVVTVAAPSLSKRDFTIIPNAIIDHPELSDRAVRLLVHLLSKSSDYVFYDEKLRELLKCGRDGLKIAFKELRQAGYVTNIATLNDYGSVCGSRRLFSDKPEFIDAKPNLCVVRSRPPEKPVSLGNTRPPEKHVALETSQSSPLYTNTKILNNNNNYSTNNPREVVVASLGENEMELLVNKLVEYGAAKPQAEKWAKMGEKRVSEVLRLMDERMPTIRDKGAFMFNAFRLDWMPSGKIKTSQEATKKPTKTKEEAMEWARNEWWIELDDQDKIKAFDKAIDISTKTNRFVFLDMAKPIQRQNIVAKSFDREPIFSLMVETLFMDISRLQSRLFAF